MDSLGGVPQFVVTKAYDSNSCDARRGRTVRALFPLELLLWLGDSLFPPPAYTFELLSVVLRACQACLLCRRSILGRSQAC